MIKVDYDGIEDFVKENDNMSWDGWSVNVDTPDHAARMKKVGIQRDGQWYRRKIVSFDDEGFWTFKEDDVNTRRARP
jgi:hypothetical protein